jgi:hypothetical protein
MTRNQTLITICIAFVMGCIAGPMASQVVVRPARAEPNGARKWEQYCSFRKVGYWDDVINDTNQDLKARGLEGWELASTALLTEHGNAEGLSYCFRRPIP